MGFLAVALGEAFNKLLHLEQRQVGPIDSFILATRKSATQTWSVVLNSDAWTYAELSIIAKRSSRNLKLLDFFEEPASATSRIHVT